MLKRTLLALSFVAALCAAGFGVTSTAEAGHGCGRGGYDGGYGYGGYGYRSYYQPAPYYRHGYPRLSYYRDYDHGHHHHHHDHGSSVYFSIGF